MINAQSRAGQNVTLSHPISPKTLFTRRNDLQGHKIYFVGLSGDSLSMAVKHWFEQFMRESDQREEEIKQRHLARALEAGFASIEEHTEARIKEEREANARYRERIERETGKTWEEYWATHPQREKTPPAPRPVCDCEGTKTAPLATCRTRLTYSTPGHLIPWFCAKSLVDYRTQDAPTLVDLYQSKTDQDIWGLQIDPSAPSKRLSQSALERRWEWETQEGPGEWPPWLKGDAVLQRVQQQESNALYQEQARLGKEIIARRGTPPSSIYTEDRCDMGMPNAMSSPSPPTGTSFYDEGSLTKPANELTTPVQEANERSREGPSAFRDTQQSTSRRAKRKLKTADIDQSRFTRASGVRKNTDTTRRRRGTDGPMAARSTRSQHVSKFYELDATGFARSYRRLSRHAK